MENRKEDQEERPTLEEHVVCQVCGREIEPDACSWHEDEGGMICCPDCRAERESCGCSD